MLLRRMTDALYHRGPDGDGFYCAPGIGLGHRRLAIVDLVTGDQPMFNEDRTVCVVFNGEIYNFQPLMAELAALGHVFRTRSDTEVIVHAWEEWGEGCLDHFNGMFAFALWDARRETLFLARDRLGEKPLYYCFLSDGRLLFASELKALLASPDVPRRLDPQAIEDFFAFGYIPDPRSIYRGRAQASAGPFPAGPARRGRCRRRAVTGMCALSTAPPARKEEVEEELIARLREVGPHADDRRRAARRLSVGRRRFERRRGDDGGLEAGAGQHLFDRLRVEGLGRIRATPPRSPQRYRTEHRVREVDPNSFDLIDRLATIYDEPFGDSSAIPTFRVCAMARENVTVALSGDGGDEVFAGYRRYRWHCLEERVRRVLPQALRRPLFGALRRALSKARLGASPAARQGDPRRAGARSGRGVFLVRVDLQRRASAPDVQRRALARAAGLQCRRGVAVAYGPVRQRGPAVAGPIRRFQDLPAGRHPHQGRSREHGELARGARAVARSYIGRVGRALPSRLKLRGGQGKHIFKAALEPHVSKEILYRPKQGFAVPLAAWFRGPLRRRLRERLCGPVLRELGLVRHRHDRDADRPAPIRRGATTAPRYGCCR